MRRAGFTLLEVLLATALTVVIGLAVAQVVHVSHRAQQRARARAEARGLKAQVARRLQDDLLGLLPPGGLYAAGLVGEDDDGDGQDLLPATLRGAAVSAGPTDEPPVAGRDRLTVAVVPPALAWGDALPAGQGPFWHVVWEIDADAATPEQGLVRRVVRVRDPVPGSEPEPAEALAPEAVGLDVRYFDGTAWQETWDSGASDTLPQLVQARVAIAIDGELHVLQVVVAPVTARIGADATASEGGQ